MTTAAEKYEQVVKVIHRYRTALPEGDEGSKAYYGTILREVFQIVKEDVKALVMQDYQDKTLGLGGDSEMT
jgi:hypothetical protein